MDLYDYHRDISELGDTHVHVFSYFTYTLLQRIKSAHYMQCETFAAFLRYVKGAVFMAEGEDEGS